MIMYGIRDLRTKKKEYGLAQVSHVRCGNRPQCVCAVLDRNVWAVVDRHVNAVFDRTWVCVRVCAVADRIVMYACVRLPTAVL